MTSVSQPWNIQYELSSCDTCNSYGLLLMESPSNQSGGDCQSAKYIHIHYFNPCTYMYLRIVLGTSETPVLTTHVQYVQRRCIPFLFLPGVLIYISVSSKWLQSIPPGVMYGYVVYISISISIQLWIEIYNHLYNYDLYLYNYSSITMNRQGPQDNINQHSPCTCQAPIIFNSMFVGALAFSIIIHYTYTTTYIHYTNSDEPWRYYRTLHIAQSLFGLSTLCGCTGTM